MLSSSCYFSQVHPFHTSDASLAKEGYHDRYPNELFTYRELEAFTKYNTWPAFFATPLCNLYDPNTSKFCSNMVNYLFKRECSLL